MTERTFLDWNDANAFAAAECAVRLMREGWEYTSAVAEASKRYSCDHFAVARWVDQSPFAAGMSAGYLGQGRDKNPYAEPTASEWSAGYDFGDGLARDDLHEKRTCRC